MKLKIYKPKIVKPKPKRKTIRLALANALDGVKILAVDENGGKISQGNLIVFRTNGTINFCKDVNLGLGFQLNALGQIKGDLI